MDPLVLGALIGIVTILVLFSGVSVAVGLLIVSAGFLFFFNARDLELIPELFLRCPGQAPQPVLPSVKWASQRCVSEAFLMAWPLGRLLREERLVS